MEGNDTSDGKVPALQESENKRSEPTNNHVSGFILEGWWQTRLRRHWISWTLPAEGKESHSKGYCGCKKGLLGETEPHREEWERSPPGGVGRVAT